LQLLFLQVNGGNVDATIFATLASDTASGGALPAAKDTVWLIHFYRNSEAKCRAFSTMLKALVTKTKRMHDAGVFKVAVVDVDDKSAAAAARRLGVTNLARAAPSLYVYATKQKEKDGSETSKGTRVSLNAKTQGDIKVLLKEVAKAVPTSIPALPAATAFLPPQATVEAAQQAGTRLRPRLLFLSTATAPTLAHRALAQEFQQHVKIGFIHVPSFQVSSEPVFQSHH
jgi:hypothetical protein